MRVMHIMSGARVGGAETFFVDLTSALHRAGLEQCVIIRRNAARANALKAAGMAPVELLFNHLLTFKTRDEIAEEIERFRPDIVQTWMSRASTTCPTGPFIHVGWLGGYYDLKYFRKCDELVGVTRDLVTHVVGGGWPLEHAYYLPTLASNIPMPPLDRAQFDTPEKVPLILALGRLHPVKGFDVLLEALKNVPDAYLWLAGEGPLRAKLEAQAQALGLDRRVRFLGWRDDRAALFASCDFCVMPSRAEPFGTVMIEAWAYRRPIIAAAAKGPLALIKNGENGLLVPMDDAAALTVAMRRLIDEPKLYAHIVDTAWAEYQNTYTEAKVVERYLDFYKMLLNGRAKA